MLPLEDHLVVPSMRSVTAKQATGKYRTPFFLLYRGLIFQLNCSFDQAMSERRGEANPGRTKYHTDEEIQRMRRMYPRESVNLDPSKDINQNMPQ